MKNLNSKEKTIVQKTVQRKTDFANTNKILVMCTDEEEKYSAAAVDEYLLKLH